MADPGPHGGFHLTRAVLIATALSVLSLGATALTGFSASSGSTMMFHGSTVPAVGTVEDLYEPSIGVSPTGVLYAAGHSIGAFTQRAPAWVSRDDGASWSMLPGLAPAQTGSYLADSVAAGGQGEGDEGIVVADAAGHAWMLDNGPVSDVLYSWCDDGRTLCGTDHLAYSVKDDLTVAGGKCNEAGITDRPWLAHGHGKLLLENNGGGIMQLVLYDPATGRVSANDCAGSGSVPGAPAVRESDGLFIVPQVQGKNMVVVRGTDPRTVTTVPVFASYGGFDCSADFGFSAFSAAGTAYVAGGATNKSVKVAASPDGFSWKAATIATADPLAFMWVSGNPAGEGALLSWATTSDGCGTFDYFAAHVRLDATGAPLIQDVTKALSGFAGLCGDYATSGVGPDGRAYFATVNNGCGVTSPPGASPLQVWIQDGGPTL